jgi:acyl-CoA thioesterase
MRPHPGVGQQEAHRSISTGVLSLTVHFHAPCDLQGWMLLDHDALHAGRGLCDGKGRIFDASARLLASFEQEALLRPLPADRTGGAKVL